MTELQKKSILVKEIKPGDRILGYSSISGYSKPVYVKNIYHGSVGVSPIVEQVEGKCVVLEFTDSKEKCNLNNYTAPEMKAMKDLDFSVQTPSVYPLKSSIDVIIE